VFLHHDLHPGNVAWHRGRLSAVLDWNEARLGPAVSDVAYCSVDLAASHGAAAADRLVDHYQAATGQPLEDIARWQLLWVANAVRWIHYWQAGYRELGLGHVPLSTLRRRLATFADRALQRCGG
jgi:aminoglycoside phosphotransferase (APT) family kinase protein